MILSIILFGTISAVFAAMAGIHAGRNKRLNAELLKLYEERRRREQMWAYALQSSLKVNRKFLESLNMPERMSKFLGVLLTDYENSVVSQNPGDAQYIWKELLGKDEG